MSWHCICGVMNPESNLLCFNCGTRKTKKNKNKYGGI